MTPDDMMRQAAMTAELYAREGSKVFMDSPNWSDMPDDMREALEMIAHKIGRILNGDPNYADSWIDIAGYAKLVADRLEGKVR